MAQPVQTAATQVLQNLNPNVIIDANFNKRMAFLRATKVFIQSYRHLIGKHNNTFQNIITEYFAVIADLYGIDSQTFSQLPSNWQNQVQNVVDGDRVQIQVRGIQFEGSVTNATLFIHLGDLPNIATTLPIYIDPNDLTQFKAGLALELTQQQFQLLFDADQKIRIKYEDIYWGNRRQDFDVFSLPYQQLHPEGYQMWIRFGKGIRVLISIRFKAIETNANPFESNSFHIHSFYYMIQKRLERYRLIGKRSAHIHHSFPPKHLTYLQPRVDVNSRQAFWDITPTNITDPYNPNRSCVKFMDMQIGFRVSDQIEDQFCTCNEFCNLNAFFHYNQIYRFLLVRHNQLYIENRTNIGGVYQLVISYLMRHQPPPATLPNPLARLLTHANQQRMADRFQSLVDNEFGLQYNNNYPIVDVITGLTYNMLRYNVPMADICIETDSMPFCEQSLENIDNYYKMLFDLHIIIGNNQLFVVPNNSKDWDKEFESFYRRDFHVFIIWSHRETVSSANVFSDYMFTEDYEYSSAAIRSKEEKQFIKSRKALLLGINVSPFNLRFLCQAFTYSMTKVSEFITKFEPYISRVYLSQALREVNSFCIVLDQSFDTISSALNPNSYRVDCPHIPIGLTAIKDQIFVYYKLKTYFHAFNIQRYFCYSKFNRANKTRHLKRQAFMDCKHIWNNSWIEDIFRDRYPNQEIQLFHTTDSQIPVRFNNFFDTFWQKANYETQAVLPTQVVIIPEVVSKYSQLMYWQQNNGNNRLKFRAILEELNNCLNEVMNESEVVFRYHICKYYPTIEYLYSKDNHFIEVIDQLVYWLVKATAFMVNKKIAVFLLNLTNRANLRLEVNKKMYLLCKPGFVPLFQTIANVFQTLNTLKTYYIVFDDILDRIHRTVSQAKAIIKGMYKMYFCKLSCEWLEEIENLFNKNYPNGDSIMKLHLISGLSFLTVLLNSYRKPSQRIRKKLKAIRSTNSNIYATQTQFNQTWDQWVLWLSQVDQITSDTPFASPHWVQHCHHELAQFAPHHQQMGSWLTRADHL